MPPLLGLPLLLLACLALWVGGVIILTLRTLTRPPRRTYAAALATGRPGDPSELPPRASNSTIQTLPSQSWQWSAWSFTSRNQELPVWDIKGLDPSGPTIVLTHGWGDSRIGALTRAVELAPNASRLILWDLPAHGEAPGRCLLGTREVDDLLALLDRLEAPIVLFGWSLGAGISIAAAAKPDAPAHNRIVAVIAEAPYRHAITPARNVLRLSRLPHHVTLPIALKAVQAFLGARGLTSATFDRADLASQFSIPLLVIQGEQDNVCPIAEAKEIAAAAPKGQLVPIPGGGHHGLWTQESTRQIVSEACRNFITTQPAHPLPAGGDRGVG